MISWMSFSAAFVLYFLLEKLSIPLFETFLFEPGSVSHSITQLIIFTFGFLAFFVLRYLIVSAMAMIFDMSSVKNVHYATHLRLTFYLLLVLQSIITLDYFSIAPISSVFFLIILVQSYVTLPALCLISNSILDLRFGRLLYKVVFSP